MSLNPSLSLALAITMPLGIFLLGCTQAPEPQHQPRGQALESAESTLLPAGVSGEETGVQELETIEESAAKNTMLFRVRIPENTPEEDTIGLSLYSRSLVQMEQTGAFVYEAEVSPGQIDFVVDGESGKIVWYAYVRNQLQDASAPYNSEFIPGTENTNDYFWTKRGRSIVFKPGTVQEDTIERWKWFPAGASQAENISGLGPDRGFEPRFGNERFRSGQGLMDEYNPWMDHLFSPTAKHMREMGYEWIVFFPAWDWERDSTKILHLKIDEESGEVLGFPDEKMVKQIRDFKAQGLKVMLAPQVCCTPIDREDRSLEWWSAYWREVERFYLHYAMMAEEESVEALVADFALIGNTTGMGDSIMRMEQDSWKRIWNKIGNLYSGERGQMVWQFDTDMGGLSPEPDFIEWADKIDFFYVQSAAGISADQNPAEDELYQGAKKLLLDIKRLHDASGKPVIVQSQFSSMPRAWKGEFSEDRAEKSICDDDTSDEGCGVFFSGRDQARAVNAFWQAIAEEPWVIGYTSFGYRPQELPLKPEWSVRGKPADEVWAKWNDLAYHGN